MTLIDIVLTCSNHGEYNPTDEDRECPECRPCSLANLVKREVMWPDGHFTTYFDEPHQTDYMVEGL